ncbi:MAG: DNA topoisomerase III [Ruminococcaceae bacterium]|nr:DNA topoisomerase III [Oscillospiraceae bacterium]
MILIIAEKPSLARNIAAGIGSMARRDGYLEGNGYLITWAFGHLFSLADIEDYQGVPATEKVRWTMDNLPCIPDTFRFDLKKDKDTKKVDAGVQKQFKTIESLCNRADVDTIVNAGDADREGEIIVRLCVQHAGAAGKTQKRLWLPDQTPETVREALTNLGDATAYESLAAEGFARTYIDWLYGVNLTRYATLKCGSLLRVGRVIVPIVRAIYERDMAIRNFVPGKYLALVSREETGGEIVELVSKQKFDEKDRARAEALCALYNETGAFVKSVKRKKDTLAPGKLFSLSKLQNVLGKKYKMSMADSLAIIQSLYERGYLTYPRTNSEYLATAEKDKIKKILASCKQLGYDVAFKDSPKIFDDSKIESHSALTPTYKIPKKGELSEKENQVYATVFRRFAAVFCATPCTAERTEITVAVGELEEFVLKGLVILERGWMKYDDATQKDKVLPKLAKGDAVNIRFEPKEKETSPPKHYTIETLNNYLKNPFREEKAAAEDTVGSDDSAEYKAVFEGLELGTEATRTGIIDNARKSGYIALNKDVYTILPQGEYLVESLDRMQIRMDKFRTSEMGRALKKVFRGEMTVEDSVALAARDIREIFEKKEASLEEDTDIGLYGVEVGACPLCGKPVVRGKFSYGCTGYKEGCGFRVNTVICGRVISVRQMQMLLTEGKTAPIRGFVSKKTGKSFDAALRLEEGKAIFDFSDVPRREPRRPEPIFDDSMPPPAPNEPG